MNLADCAFLVDETLSAFRQGFDVSQGDGVCRVVTPFQRRDGDQFEIVARPEGSEGWPIRVTDDGATLDYLDLNGIHTDRNRALDRLVGEVVRAHGIQVLQGEIVVYVSRAEEVGAAVLRVLAAMNDLSQFELTRRQREPQTFQDMVAGELVGLGVGYEREVTLPGDVRSRSFRFYINGQRQIILEPLQARDSTRAVERAKSLIVDVMDVWKRQSSLAAVAVLDDQRDVWRDRAIPDLAGFGINTVEWSQRHSQLQPLIENPRRGAA